MAEDSQAQAPRVRRGHRRVTSGSTFTGQEPTLPGLSTKDETAQAQTEQQERDRWLKEQRPPHHYFK